MSKYILSVSYSESLLITRRMLLEREGYRVASALGFPDSTIQCRKGGFHLFILGHSIPRPEKEELIRLFRNGNHAPVLLLKRDGEESVVSVEHYVSPDDPHEFLRVVAAILEPAAAQSA